MAGLVTKVADVIVPEIWARYAPELVTQKSELINSGIAQNDEAVAQLISGGGRMLHLPMWKELSGEDEVMSDSAAITTAKLSSAVEIAPVLIRAKGWAVNELAGALAGDDPFKSILTQYAIWWSRREQAVALSIMKALFDETNGALKENLSDIAALADAAGVISAAAVLDAKQKLGDNALRLTCICMHSDVYTALQKQDLIEYLPASVYYGGFSTYLGYRVLVDDNMPKSADAKPEYTTYLFGEGAFVRAEGSPPMLTTMELARDAAASEDRLFTRRAFVLHPRGTKYIGTAAGATPSNAELEDPESWQLVAAAKGIPLVALTHKV